MTGWLIASGLLLAAISSRKPTATGGPGVVERGTLTSPFGVRRSETHVHQGIDIAAPRGTPVRALANGIVLDYAPDCERSGYGNALLVQHDDGYLSFYAHLDRVVPNVYEGSRVGRGQTIGYVGTTNCRSGTSSAMAPHLHLEVHASTSRTASGKYVVSENIPKRVDPEAYMKSAGLPVSDRMA